MRPSRTTTLRSKQLHRRSSASVASKLQLKPLAFLLLLLCVVVGLCAVPTRGASGDDAGDGGDGEWLEDDVEVEEYVLESPTSIDTFMQQAMREAREAPGYVRDPKLNDIFPGGVVHTRALGIARGRGMFRTGVVPPALGGGGKDDVKPLPPPDGAAASGVDVAASSAASASASVAGNESSAASSDASTAAAAEGGGEGKDDAAAAAATAASSSSAWGSGDVLGGLLVMEGGEAGESGGKKSGDGDPDGNPAPSSPSEDADDDDDDDGAALTPMMDRYRRGVEVGEAIATGAIANSGALPKPEDWAAAAHEDLSPTEVPWLVAQEVGEATAARAIKERRVKARERERERDRLAAESPGLASSTSSSAAGAGSSSLAATSSSTGSALAAANDDKVEELYANMTEWFESKGGRLEGVNVTFVPGKPGDGRGLVATARLAAGAKVMRVPASLTLSSISARNLRVKGGQVGEQLKPLFSSNPDQALAVLLLHEHLKERLGDGSKWGPYIRTLGHAALGTPVLRALAGTYAAEVFHARRDEAMKIYQELSGGVCMRASSLCQRNPGRHQAGSFTRDDLRWAMGVVRSRAVWITRRTTVGLNPLDP
jgi:hypothetical protein